MRRLPRCSRRSTGSRAAGCPSGPALLKGHGRSRGQDRVSEERCVVAVDGPSGSGKSTVSRRLAVALGARYLDTGAMYRAVTLAVLQAGVDPGDAEAVAKVAADAHLTSGTDPLHPTIRLDGVAVDTEIRSPAVT